MTTHFEGPTTVVIGGASVIGFKTAEEVLVGGGELDGAAVRLSRSGSAWSVAADLTDRDQTDRDQVVEAQQQLAGTTHLVSSAGLVRIKSPASNSPTGAVFYVDGGVMAGRD